MKAARRPVKPQVQRRELNANESKDGSMQRDDVRQRLDKALQRLSSADAHLLENNLSERCIAARLAMYLQDAFPDHKVDVEYNRKGCVPKRLGVPEECANYFDQAGNALVVPDVIVHERGERGPNVLVLELKKTSNPDGFGCDRTRILAFRDELHYEFGALIECETRRQCAVGIRVAEWFGD